MPDIEARRDSTSHSVTLTDEDIITSSPASIGGGKKRKAEVDEQSGSRDLKKVKVGVFQSEADDFHVRIPPIISRIHEPQGEDDAQSSSQDVKESKLDIPPSATDKVYVRVPPLAYPPSKYLGWEPPLPVTPEKLAIRDLHEAWISSSRNQSAKSAAEYECFTLDKFTFYRPEKGHRPGELASLQDLKGRRGADTYLFDGVLSTGTVQRWVEGVPFTILSIEGYGKRGAHAVSGIYIQSHAANAQNIWYKVGRPAPHYERFHQHFLWHSNFTKFAVDYLLDKRKSVALHHFRENFCEWCVSQHRHDERFQSWLRAYGKTDFRPVVVASAEFLWKEATDIDNKTRNHPLWKEVDGCAIQRQENVEENTLVTPFVYECFKDMYFGDFLESRAPVEKTATACRKRKKALGLFTEMNSSEALLPTMLEEGHETRFQIGDIVGVHRDSDSAWKDKASIWYAYIQKVREDYQDRQLLDVLWLYAPSDTICSTAYYLFKNELFLSDNCNCGDRKLYATDVACQIPVNFFAKTSASDTFFVRQKYQTDNAAFVSLKKSDFKCSHLNPEWRSDLEEVMENFQIGDTVLISNVQDPENGLLEPIEIVDFKLESEEVLARRLERRRQYEPGARLNELLYTDDISPTAASRVIRRCHVRFFTAREVTQGLIPAPYNRDGSADCWYISSWLHKDASVEEIRPPWPATLIQGIEPLSSGREFPPLAGMDLYCGGGNFGRGLEESGAVKNLWSIDWAGKAMHTYRANQGEPDDGGLFYGSVNDYLGRALSGQWSRMIATIGAALHLLAGSPCQGFSRAQPDKQSKTSKINASMVASVASFIDLYSFDYAILENVVAMAGNFGENKDQNVLAQLVCALVAMGYQLQLFNLDAWSFGAPQSRSRLFISIAAPKFELPPHPHLTHSHPPGQINRSLGKAINGEPFGKRRFDKTPFKFSSAKQGAADLPFIGDALVPNIRFPDHRPSIPLGHSKRQLMAHIPRWPHGQNFISAFNAGRIPQCFMDNYGRKSEAAYDPKSAAWMRIRPHGLMPTIATAQVPACVKTGRLLHWDEPRVISIMEARRAQGVPDDEILIGSPVDQYHIIGNSVARQVAVGLGMSLREALIKNEEARRKQMLKSEEAVAGKTAIINSEKELMEGSADGVKELCPTIREQAAIKIVVPATPGTVIRERTVTDISISGTSPKECRHKITVTQSTEVIIE